MSSSQATSRSCITAGQAAGYWKPRFLQLTAAGAFRLRSPSPILDRVRNASAQRHRVLLELALSAIARNHHVEVDHRIGVQSGYGSAADMLGHMGDSGQRRVNVVTQLAEQP